MSWEGSTGRWTLAMLLATLLWVAVAAERRAELRLSVPVALEEVPAGLAVQGAPQRVLVTLYGPRIRLLRARLAPPVCRLDLSGTGPGTVQFRSLDGALALDGELKISRIYPATLSLTLVRQTER